MSSPLVSVVLAARDAERFLGQAVASVLGQTVRELELVVVDDGSRDRTPEILASVGDPRLVVLRNEEPAGLASALNRGLEQARGRYVARIDADDVALPRRLERQLALLRADDGLAIVGSAVAELDGRDGVGRVHPMPLTPTAVRWHALFSSPFFHPSVLFDREVLDRHRLRYDPDYLESEDYDLWARLLAVSDGSNAREPLLLYRLHAEQASQRRRDLQRRFQLEVALRQIGSVAPDLVDAELAWRIGCGEPVPEGAERDAVEAYLELVSAFTSAHANDPDLPSVRRTAARPLARAALALRGAARLRAVRAALSLDPALPLRDIEAGRRQRLAVRTVRAEAGPWLDSLASPRRGRPEPPVRLTIVLPEPTPFRSVMLDRVATRRELDLSAIYSGHSLQRRTWGEVPLHHRARFLRGIRVPGVWRVLHHEYPITPGIWRALGETRPEVVVVSGWSTFAAQAAVVWCRLKRVPYVSLVESNEVDPRSAWRRAVKAAVVPRVLGGARSVLSVGGLSDASVIARGVEPSRIRRFADTVDVHAFAARADRLAARRAELRGAVGVGSGDVVVLSVARLDPEKGLDTLVRGAALADDPRLVIVVAGEGAQREALVALARDLGVRLILLGDLPWERIVEAYAMADVFALLSTWEPWGVVVNEAAACGLPLVLADRVGAAHDLLVDGENGVLVGKGDAEAVGAALRLYASNQSARLAAAARSRALMRRWGYEPSIENLVTAAREATAR